MSQKQNNKDKYNRTGPGANQTVFTTIAKNTGIQEDVKEVKKKKKATFELDPNLHRKLKMYAANHDTKMVDVVEQALNDYLNNNK